MRNGDMWKTLFVLGVLLVEPVLMIYGARTPAGTGIAVSPLIALPVAALALAGVVWWVLRRDGRRDEGE